jgi:hypothetical protein
LTFTKFDCSQYRSTSIVQMRAFSFSDDSANVGMPFQRKPSSPSSTSSSNNGTIWTRKYDLSLACVRLRQIQSEWYTKLFQSSREPMSDPYSYIWKIYREMDDWFNTLPANTSPPLKQLFNLDLLYSYVYILSPSYACPHPSEHAQRLVIEHCATYAKMILTTISTPPTEKKPSPFSFYDAIRVYMMGRNFVDTLSSNFESLIQFPRNSTFSTTSTIEGANLDPFSSPQTAQAPPLPTPDVGEHPSSPVSRAIETIEAYQSILASFSIRFGYVSSISWRDKFQAEAAPLLAQLQQRQQMQQRQSTSSTADTVASSSASYFWPATSTTSGTSASPSGGPMTPTTHQLMDTSPLSHQAGSSASFYPSPPATQYSPVYIAPELHEGLKNTGPVGGGTSWYANNEFGIDNMAAWKTLPGGPLNPRFS